MSKPIISYRNITDSDFSELKEILQDEDLMLLGWGKTFTDEEVRAWLTKIQEQYAQFGYSYFAVIDQRSGAFVGIVGLIQTKIKGQDYVEIAYIIKKEFQGKGRATSVVEQLLQIAFENYQLEAVIAQFVPDNIASQKVAEKCGMTYLFDYERVQSGKLKEHQVYIKRNKQ